MTIRGYEFTGHDFDLLAPVEDIPAIAKEFRLNKGYLCSYCIECSIPVPMFSHKQQLEGLLHAKIVLGNPNERDGLDNECVFLCLDYEGNTNISSGNSGW